MRHLLLAAGLLSLACGGIGQPPPAPDVAGAYAAFGCEAVPKGDAGEACALVAAFDNGQRPELGPTGETSGTRYENWVGPSYAAGPGLEQRYMSAPRKWYIEANTPYMGFRELWPDTDKERADLDALIAASREGREAADTNAALAYVHLLESSASDFLRLVQKTERSWYLKPPSASTCGDGCSRDIQAWVRQDGEGLVLLESRPEGVRVSALYRVR